MSTTSSQFLTLDQVKDISDAATALAMCDKYLAFGTVNDRKMAATARVSKEKLELIIERDIIARNLRVSFPNDI